MHFSNVCELDLIYNFASAHFLLEEVVCGGFIVESSKSQAAKIVATVHQLLEPEFLKE